MKGISNPDGWVRLDFPGGWDGDQKNAFTKKGLSADEISVQELTGKVANFRKTSSALKTGKQMHYVPDNGLYVYFRYDDDQTVMCIMNTSKENRSIKFTDYSEKTNGFNTTIKIVSGEKSNTNSSPVINAGEMWILKLEK